MDSLLELSQHIPIDKITVKQIVEQSGLSLKTFYNHFTDKYALMIHIEEAAADRLLEKLKEGGYSFRDYLFEGVRLYNELKVFICNALENTSGQDSFERQHSRASYEAILRFVLRRNELNSIPEDIRFALRMYAFGLLEMFFEYTFRNKDMTAEVFVQYCEENMPERLKAYLL